MSFKDIFKNSFLSGYTGATIDTKTIIISLGITAIIGLYIFFTYKLITRKTFYNQTFNISLVGMTVITAAIILTIQSNVVLSLGMVGALSIVRFRTAVKDPLDLVFLYWAISVGIICGAGIALAAMILSVFMTVALVVLQSFPQKKLSKILVINAVSSESQDEIFKLISKQSRKYKVKSKNITKNSCDMIIEVNLPEEGKLLEDIMQVSGVLSASLLSHDGEMTV